MKITISYVPSEAVLADRLLSFARLLLPDVKVRRANTHPPQISIYMTTKRPQ